MATPAVPRDLGEALAHGEPEQGMGQGDAAEAAESGSGDGPQETVAAAPPASSKRDNGVVVVDFGGLGPDAA
jgi:hypothetical protein